MAGVVQAVRHGGDFVVQKLRVADAGSRGRCARDTDADVNLNPFRSTMAQAGWYATEPKTNPLLEPVDGDEIDELVNWQIENGKGNWK